MLAQWTPVRWFCLALGAFLLVRAIATLAVEIDFGTPGTGWRSAWQLVVVAVLLVGLLRPGATTTVVTIVAVVYAAATLLELVDGTSLLGVIPVDMRDRWVHPAVAALCMACIAATRIRRRSTARAEARCSGHRGLVGNGGGSSIVRVEDADSSSRNR